jgi:GntR family transcriptional regulator
MEAPMSRTQTDRMEMVLGEAGREARQRGAACVEGLDLVRALLADAESVAAAVLLNLGVDAAAARAELACDGAAPVTPARGGGPASALSTGAEALLAEADAEAERRGQPYLGPEHLLVAVLRRGGEETRPLTRRGVTAQRVEEELSSLLDETPSFRFRVDDAERDSIYEQLVAQVCEAVATGRLRPGDRLSTVRRTARELGIAPGTVGRAYAELERRGVVVTRGARGTRVARRPPAPDPEAAGEALPALLRRAAVGAYHHGLAAPDLRRALEEAMRGIFPPDAPPATP